MNAFWINVKNSLSRSGITQRELSKLIGVPFNTVSSWLKNDRLPDLMSAIKIGEILGISVRGLAGLETERTVRPEETELYDALLSLSEDDVRLLTAIAKRLAG